MGWFSDTFSNGLADGILNPTKAQYEAKQRRKAAAKAKAAAEAQPSSLAGNKAYIEGRESLDAQMALADDQFRYEQDYGRRYTDLNNELAQSTLLGKKTIDTQRAFAEMDPGTRAEIERIAKQNGITPDQWFTNHVLAQMGTDPVAKNAYEKYGKYEGGLIGMLGEASPMLGKIQADANTQQRTADVADVEALGGRANDAFRAANPQLAALLDDQATHARAGAQQSNLEKLLTQQAEGDLAMGGNLTPAQQAMIDQQSRASFSARGLGRSQSAAIGEALNAFDYSRQLQNERRGFAGSVNTMNQQRTQLGGSLLSSAAASQSANSIDPFMSILGRPSTALGSAQGAYGSALGSNEAAGPTMFNPFSSDIMSIYSGAEANKTAADGAKDAKKSAMIGAGASVAAAVIIAL